MGKSTKAPHISQMSIKTKDVLELVHTDLWGPSPVTSMGSARYFLSFIDDWSRKCFIYILKTKDEVYEKFLEFKAMTERQTGRKLKRLRSDNGLEFCNRKMQEECKRLGIIHEKTNYYSPQMNGVAERLNRSLMDMVNTMLVSSNLPKQLWGEAISTASYIKNRILHSSINDAVPQTRWNNRIQSIRHLKIFGSVAYVHIPKQKRNKLEPKAERGIMVGYARHTRGYRIWIEGTKTVIESKHVTFMEQTNIPLNKENVLIPLINEQNEIEDEIMHNDIQVETNDDKSEDITLKADDDIPKERRRSEQKQKELKECKNIKDKAINLEAHMVEMIIPQSYDEALQSPQYQNWQEAMTQEINMHMRQHTWEIVIPPPKAKIIPSKWVYNVKTDQAGRIIRYKARIVAKGCAQRDGIDFDETFSPVVNFCIIRVMLTIASLKKWTAKHLDVNCAYLYGTLDEQLYMRIPCGIEKGREKNKVCLLKKAIYGLRQAGLRWYKYLDNIFNEMGCEQLQATNCVYRYKNVGIILVYVDDLFIFGEDEKIITELTDKISCHLDIKDLGEPSNILGVNITHNEDETWSMDQEKYIIKILNKYGYLESRHTKTPVDPGIKFTGEIQDPCDKPFREVIWHLMFLGLRTRPDILFAVTELSQFSACPDKVHCDCITHILRYLELG